MSLGERRKGVVTEMLSRELAVPLRSEFLSTSGRKSELGKAGFGTIIQTGQDARLCDLRVVCEERLLLLANCCMVVCTLTSEPME